MQIATGHRTELSLKDRLSRLTHTQACRLLGPDGAKLICEGGKREVVIEEQVYLDGDLFRLRLGSAVVTITLMAEAKQRLHWNCTQCDGACDHVGTAFSLILEEKTALGLAAPPPERVPVESLGEAELIQQAIAERQERARIERMTVKALDPGRPWTDYLVTNAVSGRTYRVALRGLERGQSYCSCPDFRKNTLGTCKHILHLQAKIKRRFDAAILRRPYVQKDVAVHLLYGRDLELRLLLPPKMNGPAHTILAPLAGKPIHDLSGLLQRIRKIEALGETVIVYPDAEEYIQHRLAIARIQDKVAEIRKNPRLHPLRRNLLKTELLPYQLDGIAFAAGAGRAILADDMGLGKTIQGLGVAELLASEVGIGKVLVVCPTSLKSQWRSEIQRFSGRDCQLVMGSALARVTQYQNNRFFTICNYEQVLRDITAIEQVKWDLIILDEGQRIKNWEAKTSRVVKGLRSRFALVLSGTPLENRLDDLFSVAEFIDDRRLGPAFRFYNRHRIVDEKGKILGYKNLDELRRTLAPILLRRTRQSVMQDLPPRTVEIVRIPPTAEQLGLHRANMQIVIAIVRKKYISEMDLLRLQKALLLCRMSADSTFLVDKQKPGFSTKLEELDDLLDRLNQEKDRKIVLFSEWTTMLNQIQPLITKHRMRYVRLDGSIPQSKRQPLVHTFQTDPDCKLFITTNAGSTGLNLQAANTVINVDLPWNPAVLEQRIARAHRMGQKRPVQVFVLVTEGTIEENLMGTLSAKRELAQAVLDPDSDLDHVDLVSGIQELKNRLEVLLGARPDAALDESEQRRAAEEAERVARQERLSTAGGQLLAAAFRFMSEMAPHRAETEDTRRAGELIRARLAECLTRDDTGQLRLTVTLPDESAVQDLAQSLARFLSPRP